MKAAVHLALKKDWLVALSFALLFVVHATMIRPVVQNADPVLYAYQIEQHDFVSRAIHIGYFLVGTVFHAVLPFRTDTSLNVMALTFGVGGAFALYSAASLLGSRAAGVCSVVFLLCSRSYVRGMLMAEVDILEASLVTMSFALYVNKRAVAAGLVFGVAMLVTPVAVAMLPLFLATFPVIRGEGRELLRRQTKRIFWFGICALFVYLPYVAWNYHGYVYGPRGLATAPRLPFDIAAQAIRGWKFFARESRAMMVLYFAGIVSALLTKRLWLTDQVGLGVSLSIALTVAIADRADVPVHLPNIVILCLLAALLVDRLAATTKLAWCVPLAAAAMIARPAYAVARAEVSLQDHRRKLYESMRAQSRPFDVIVVGVSGFTGTRVFERYAYGESHPGTALTPREFRDYAKRHRRKPGSGEIWCAGGVPDSIQAELEKTYELTSRRAEGTNFGVLVPRLPKH